MSNITVKSINEKLTYLMQEKEELLLKSDNLQRQIDSCIEVLKMFNESVEKIETKVLKVDGSEILPAKRISKKRLNIDTVTNRNKSEHINYQQSVLDFIKDTGIDVFAFREVNNYLKDKYSTHHKTTIYKGLRRAIYLMVQKGSLIDDGNKMYQYVKKEIDQEKPKDITQIPDGGYIDPATGRRFIKRGLPESQWPKRDSVV